MVNQTQWCNGENVRSESGRSVIQTSRRCETLKVVRAVSLLDVQSTDNPHRLPSTGRRKFLFRKCPAECGEKDSAIVVTLLVSRVPWGVTALPPSSLAVCLVQNSCVVSCVFVCMSMCVSAPIQALDHVKLKLHSDVAMSIDMPTTYMLPTLLHHYTYLYQV